MLDPRGRQLFLDALRPPDDYQLDEAIGTTYSLDLMALLTAPVAFAFSAWESEDGRPLRDPLALLKAVRQCAGRVTIFCQAGKIYVPRQYQRLFCHLEGSVVQVTAPSGGSFHAKLWILRYTSLKVDGPIKYRMLCLSRNLTFDRSWDTLLCLDGELQVDRVNAFARNRPLSDFVAKLPTMSTPPGPASSIRQRVRRIADEVLRVAFECPEPFYGEALRFWPIGHEATTRSPIDGRFDRLLTVSPFVDAAFLSQLDETAKERFLISRPESLSPISRDCLKRFQNVWVLDDGADPEPEEAEPAGTTEDEPHVAEQPDEIALQGLHAKLYVADRGWNTHIWTGSANATTAAFEQNVEFMVELVGKKSVCGVNELLRRTADADRRELVRFADLLQEYNAAAPTEPTDAVLAQMERDAEQAIAELARAQLVAHVEAIEGGGESFCVTLSASAKRKCRLPQNVAVRCWPISLPDGAASTVAVGDKTWVQFPTLSFDALTSFFAFQVTVVAGAREHRQRSVLNVPLENAPADRIERVLKSLLSDPHRVLQFLLLLLAGESQNGSAMVGGGRDPQGGQDQASWFGEALFESLVRALDRSPERIDDAERVIADLGATSGGTTLLPPGLEVIWDPIWAAHQLRTRSRDE